MSTVAKKPTKKKTESFIEQAGSNLTEGEVKKVKQKKKTNPCNHPPSTSPGSGSAYRRLYGWS